MKLALIRQVNSNSDGDLIVKGTDSGINSYIFQCEEKYEFINEY
jgi:hypothetical protein